MLGVRRAGRVKDRPVVTLVDLAAFGRPTRLLWHKFRWHCAEPTCPGGSWTEDEPSIALALEDDQLEQPTAGKGQRPVDTELLQVLGSAYKASKRDEEGYTPLSELGQRAKAVSSFAARNYGFTRLSDLIKAVPNFEVKGGDDGRLLVKRLR